MSKDIITKYEASLKAIGVLPFNRNREQFQGVSALGNDPGAQLDVAQQLLHFLRGVVQGSCLCAA